MCRDERQYSSITVGTRDSKAHKENEVECHNISWPISMAISYGDASATPGMGLMVVGGVGGDRFTKSGQEPDSEPTETRVCKPRRLALRAATPMQLYGPLCAPCKLGVGMHEWLASR